MMVGEPLNIFYSMRNGIVTFFSSRVASFSVCYAIKYHQSLFSYSHLHLRRFANNPKLNRAD